MRSRSVTPRPRRTSTAARGGSTDLSITLELPFSDPKAVAPPALPAEAPRPLSVFELVVRVRAALDAAIGPVWVSGEISNFRVPPSGHFYFTLKDERAQIPIVMFRGANSRLRFRPEDGMEVTVHGTTQIYEARGSLQIIADALEPRGAGAQQIALEQLKRQLAAEGLFAEERKRPLPFLPSCVGIITAPRGAAIRDMIVTMRQRLPSVRILLRPVRVQGSDAPGDLIAALADLRQDATAEVIIIGRGGGSREDLDAFNDEGVARAIAASTVPVVSAVGHEIDWTIADLVADRRAATPTAAAALVVPDARELQLALDSLRRDLGVAVGRQLRSRRERLSHLTRLLRDPRQVLHSLQQRVDDLGERLESSVRRRIQWDRERVTNLRGRLDALSPLAVLERGYSIVRDRSGRVVRDAEQVRMGDPVELSFARGRAHATIESSEPTPDAPDQRGSSHE